MTKDFILGEKSSWVNSYQMYNEDDENLHSAHKQEVFEIRYLIEFVKRFIQEDILRTNAGRAVLSKELIIAKLKKRVGETLIEKRD